MCLKFCRQSKLWRLLTWSVKLSSAYFTKNCMTDTAYIGQMLVEIQEEEMSELLDK